MKVGGHMKRIMFVCSGNVCRSVMAEYLFKEVLKQRKILDNYEVCSSGVFAYDGQTPPKEVIDAMAGQGIDVTGHRSKTTDSINVNNLDLILCMTSSEKLQLKTRYKGIQDKIYTLKEYIIYDGGINKDIDIDSPKSGDWKAYLECLRQISICIDKLVRLLE